MAIKFRLNELLDERNISIREFSRMVDHHHDQVRLFYHGDVKRISVEFIDKVCRNLNVPLHEVIYYEEDNVDEVDEVTEIHS